MHHVTDIEQGRSVRGNALVSLYGRGTEYTVNLLLKIKVGTVVAEDIPGDILDRVVKELNTGSYGDGKVFVYDVQDANRIRTRERGKGAL